MMSKEIFRSGMTFIGRIWMFGKEEFERESHLIEQRLVRVKAITKQHISALLNDGFFKYLLLDLF